MKKWFVLSAAVLLAACAHVNKNTVNYQTSLFDHTRYYVVAGNGPDKASAQASARANMRAALQNGAPDAAQLPVLADVLANVKTEKVWKEKGAKPANYFALAVLDRALAQGMFTPHMDTLDAKLAGFTKKLNAGPEPFAALKLALNMQPFVQERNAYQDLYAFINASQEGYKADDFATYKAALKNAMGAVKVSVQTQGPQHLVLTALITDALNRLGLGVADASATDAPLTVRVETTVDGYESEKVKGLEWCSSGASVSMVDETLGVTFARFHVQDRAGTSRAADSLRRSMQGVGEKASQQISQRMLTYLKIR